MLTVRELSVGGVARRLLKEPCGVLVKEFWELPEDFFTRVRL